MAESERHLGFLRICVCVHSSHACVLDQPKAPPFLSSMFTFSLCGSPQLRRHLAKASKPPLLASFTFLPLSLCFG